MLYLTDGKPKKLTYAKTIDEAELIRLTDGLAPQDLFWAYNDLVAEGLLYELPKGTVIEDAWKKLTLPQKGIFLTGHFIGQTNNGGLWQFFFNKPTYSVGMLQFLYELSQQPKYHLYPTTIKYDYEEALKELMEMIKDGTYVEVSTIWEEESIPFETRWEAFNRGYDRITTDRGVIQKYFYSDEFKNNFYTILNQYIQRNLNLLLKVIPSEAKKTVTKKAAILSYTQYLEEKLKATPLEVSIYYTAKATIDLQDIELYLMKFSMPDGYESIGITGYFTHVFDKMTMADIKQMHQQYHKQRLINLYYAWYLCEKAIQKDPAVALPNESLWAEICQLMGRPQTKLIDYIKLGGLEYFIHDDADFPTNVISSLPEDIAKRVSVSDTGDEKYPLYNTVMRPNKLVKDRVRGF